jgi:hypothetical protein
MNDKRHQLCNLCHLGQARSSSFCSKIFKAHLLLKKGSAHFGVFAIFEQIRIERKSTQITPKRAMEEKNDRRFWQLDSCLSAYLQNL